MAPMPGSETQRAGTDGSGALVADWLSIFQRIVAAQSDLFDAHRGIAARTVYAGMGKGGDRALEIDRRCEEIVFAELERLATQGHGLKVISEERGEARLGEGESAVHVIVDPIDGSLNARRTLPSHTLSIAVATGPRMADVELGYVYDFGASEEFLARRGAGATLDGEDLHAEGPGYGLEVVGIEAAEPERTLPVLEALAGKAYRLRAIGSIALSLCYVAAGRFDGMVTVRACRSVDAAAGQLIAREAGAEVALGGSGRDVGLDLDGRFHVTAALDREMLETVLQAQQRAEPPAGRAS